MGIFNKILQLLPVGKMQSCIGATRICATRIYATRIYATRIYATRIYASLLILISTGLQAQKIDISIRVFPSSWYNSYFEPGIDGMGLCFTYHPILDKIHRLNISGEYSVLRSRNEVLVGLGINRTFWQAEHFRISIEANILNGIDLFKPYPIYAGGLEAVGRFDYYVKKRLSLFAGIGARYIVCPGYRSFGVWKHSSWPVMIGIRF